MPRTSPSETGPFTTRKVAGAPGGPQQGGEGHGDALDITGAAGEEVHQAGVEVCFWGRDPSQGQPPPLRSRPPPRPMRALTGQVEERVEDVEPLNVVPLDELAGIEAPDLGPGHGWGHCSQCSSPNPLIPDCTHPSVLLHQTASLHPLLPLASPGSPVPLFRSRSSRPPLASPTQRGR